MTVLAMRAKSESIKTAEGIGHAERSTRDEPELSARALRARRRAEKREDSILQVRYSIAEHAMHSKVEEGERDCRLALRHGVNRSSEEPHRLGDGVLQNSHVETRSPCAIASTDIVQDGIASETHVMVSPGVMQKERRAAQGEQSKSDSSRIALKQTPAVGLLYEEINSLGIGCKSLGTVGAFATDVGEPHVEKKETVSARALRAARRATQKEVGYSRYDVTKSELSLNKISPQKEHHQAKEASDLRTADGVAAEQIDLYHGVSEAESSPGQAANVQKHTCVNVQSPYDTPCNVNSNSSCDSAHAEAFDKISSPARKSALRCGRQYRERRFEEECSSRSEKWVKEQIPGLGMIPHVKHDEEGTGQSIPKAEITHQELREFPECSSMAPLSACGLRAQRTAAQQDGQREQHIQHAAGFPISRKNCVSESSVQANLDTHSFTEKSQDTESNCEGSDFPSTPDSLEPPGLRTPESEGSLAPDRRSTAAKVSQGLLMRTASNSDFCHKESVLSARALRAQRRSAQQDAARLQDTTRFPVSHKACSSGSSVQANIDSHHVKKKSPYRKPNHEGSDSSERPDSVETPESDAESPEPAHKSTAAKVCQGVPMRTTSDRNCHLMLKESVLSAPTACALRRSAQQDARRLQQATGCPVSHKSLEPSLQANLYSHHGIEDTQDVKPNYEGSFFPGTPDFVEAPDVKTPESEGESPDVAHRSTAAKVCRGVSLLATSKGDRHLMLKEQVLSARAWRAQRNSAQQDTMRLQHATEFPISHKSCSSGSSVQANLDSHHVKEKSQDMKLNHEGSDSSERPDSVETPESDEESPEPAHRRTAAKVCQGVPMRATSDSDCHLRLKESVLSARTVRALRRSAQQDARRLQQATGCPVSHQSLEPSLQANLYSHHGIEDTQDVKPNYEGSVSLETPDMVETPDVKTPESEGESPDVAHRSTAAKVCQGVSMRATSNGKCHSMLKESVLSARALRAQIRSARQDAMRLQDTTRFPISHKSCSSRSSVQASLDSHHVKKKLKDMKPNHEGSDSSGRPDSGETLDVKTPESDEESPEPALRITAAKVCQGVPMHATSNGVLSSKESTPSGSNCEGSDSSATPDSVETVEVKTPESDESPELAFGIISAKAFEEVPTRAMSEVECSSKSVLSARASRAQRRSAQQDARRSQHDAGFSILRKSFASENLHSRDGENKSQDVTRCDREKLRDVRACKVAPVVARELSSHSPKTPDADETSESEALPECGTSLLVQKLRRKSTLKARRSTSAPALKRLRPLDKESEFNVAVQPQLSARSLRAQRRAARREQSICINLREQAAPTLEAAGLGLDRCARGASSSRVRKAAEQSGSQRKRLRLRVDSAESAGNNATRRHDGDQREHSTRSGARRIPERVRRRSGMLQRSMSSIMFANFLDADDDMDSDFHGSSSESSAETSTSEEGSEEETFECEDEEVEEEDSDDSCDSPDVHAGDVATTYFRQQQLSKHKFSFVGRNAHCCCFGQLPEVLCSKVLMHLRQSEIFRAAMVCRSLRHAASEPRLFRVLDARQVGRSVTSRGRSTTLTQDALFEALLRFLQQQRFRSATQLRLSGLNLGDCAPHESPILEQASKTCPNLGHLSLGTCLPGEIWSDLGRYLSSQLDRSIRRWWNVRPFILEGYGRRYDIV